MQALKPYLALIAVLAAPLAVWAQCPDQYEVVGDDGQAWLGMNAGGFIAGEGQSFEAECAGQVTLVRMELILDGQTWYGVPPLGTGDILYCDFMTTTGAVLATKSIVLDFDVGTRMISFDFADAGLDILAGDYLIACYPAAAKQARMGYHQADDIYAEGIRYISSNGGAGPWDPALPEHGDLAFRVNMNGFIPAEAHSWGQVKSLYR